MLICNVKIIFAWSPCHGRAIQRQKKNRCHRRITLHLQRKKSVFQLDDLTGPAKHIKPQGCLKRLTGKGARLSDSLLGRVNEFIAFFCAKCLLIIF